MSVRCDICSKNQQSGNKISHSNIKSRRVWKPNIKRTKAIVNGSPKTIRVCTRCLRSGRVQRAI